MPNPTLVTAFVAGGFSLSGGGTGLIGVPDAGILPLDSVSYQRGNGIAPTAQTSLEDIDRGLYDHIQISVIPRFEFGLRLHSWYRAESGIAEFNDLSPHFKLQLLDTPRWRLSIGGRDFAGAAHNAFDEAYFLVADYRTKFVDLTLGLGESSADQTSLSGLFGGLRLRPWPWLQLIADHDGVETKGGAQFLYQSRGVVFFAQASLASGSPNKHLVGVGVQVPLGIRRSTGNQGSSSAKPVLDSRTLPERRGKISELIGNFSYSGTNTLTPVDGETFDERSGLRSQLVPLVAGGIEEQAGRLRWWSGDAGYADLDWHMQLRLEPALRYTLGTEYGREDHSIGLRSSAQLLTSAGLSAYVSAETPLTHSEDFTSGGVYSQSRIRAGISEYAIQGTRHVLPGLLLQLTFGKTGMVTSSGEKAFARYETIWGLLDGRLALSYSGTHFEVGQDSGHSQSQQLKKLFAWLKGNRYALQFTHGDFQFGDSGLRSDLYIYLGSSRFALYHKTSDGQDDAVGASWSVPFGGAVGNRRFSVSGTRHFEPFLETQINTSNGRNELKPNFMKEFVPQRDLIGDVLDQWRLTPFSINQ